MKRVAIIGLGMALPPYMRSLAQLSGQVQLAYAVTRSAARRQAFEEEYGFAATGEMSPVLEDPEVDAVLLLTPPTTHRDLGERILSAGKHLLIEKPAGLTTDDARSLAEMAKGRGLLAAPALQHRFRPSVQAAVKKIASGRLGALCGVHCLIPWWRSQSYYDEPGRGSVARDGGGVLLTQAIHSLDVLRALCGTVRIASAQFGTTAIHRMEAEDIVCALAIFGSTRASGAIMATTACYPGLTETMTLIFERATLRLDGRKMEILHHNGTSEAVEDTSSQKDTGSAVVLDHARHQALLESFIGALGGEKDLVVDMSDLIATREVIDQIMSTGVNFRSG